MPRIERLTERELSQLLLNEELHYPRYLEEMTNIILQWCKDDISSLLKNKESNGDFLHFFKDNQYTDRLSLSINISEGNVFTNTRAQYYNKNYNKLKNVIKQEITSSSDNELKNINHVLNTEYKETHLPKISNNKFDVEIYKNKVNKFIDSVCHDFIKKYGGILTAYLNDFKTFNNKI